MAKQIVSDELWEKIESLLPRPKKRRSRYPGRKPLDNLRALTGILFVLKTGIPWEYLPQEMGCGCGMTCWRRLRDWHKAGVWQKLHEVLLAEMNGADQIDWSRALVDSGSVRAVGGGGKNRPESHRPPQIWKQASRPDRRGGRSALEEAHRREQA